MQGTSIYSRRLTSRFEAAQGVWVYWNCNEREDLSRVHNLSFGGLFIETPKPAAVDAEAKLEFLVDEGQIRAEAVVRYVTPGRGVGLKFTAMSDAGRLHLEALMKRLRMYSARGLFAQNLPTGDKRIHRHP